MISEVRRCAFVGKFEQVITSKSMFNNIDHRIKIKIPNEKMNETIMEEIVPSKEDL